MSRFFRKFRSSQDSSDALPPLQDTGERVIPEESRTGFARVNFIRHRVAHLYAIKRIRGAKRVLDVGCGTGYRPQFRTCSGEPFPTRKPAN